jgi:starvation-inducible DNA-binding protein
MDNKATIEGLKKLLADTYTVYLKTHNYHWNVTGPMFTTLHTLFMTQYTELALAVDEIAERIRTLNAKAPGSYREFSKLAGVNEASGDETAEEMIRQLVTDQEKIADAARAVIAAANQAGDDATADLGTRRIDIHQKNAWMLRSHLE